MHEYIVTIMNFDNEKVATKITADSFEEAVEKAVIFAGGLTILSVIFIGMVDFKALA